MLRENSNASHEYCSCRQLCDSLAPAPMLRAAAASFPKKYVRDTHYVTLFSCAVLVFSVASSHHLGARCWVTGSQCVCVCVRVQTTFVPVHMHACMHACTYMYAAWVHGCVYTCCICTHACVHVRTHVRMCACVVHLH